MFFKSIYIYQSTTVHRHSNMLRKQRCIQVVDHLQISFFPRCCGGQMHTTLLQFNLPGDRQTYWKNLIQFVICLQTSKKHWNANMKKALEIWQPSHKRKHSNFDQEAMTRSSCSQVVLVVETVTQRTHLRPLFDVQVVSFRAFIWFIIPLWFIIWIIWFVSASFFSAQLPSIVKAKYLFKGDDLFFGQVALVFASCFLFYVHLSSGAMMRNANLEAGLILSSAKEQVVESCLHCRPILATDT